MLFVIRFGSVHKRVNPVSLYSSGYQQDFATAADIEVVIFPFCDDISVGTYQAKYLSLLLAGALFVQW